MKYIIKSSRVFANMLDRCYNEKYKQFKYYGGRGIYIDDEWKSNPTAFFNWYEENYFEGGEVDRINNDGPYAPWNCRMATRLENIMNRRNTVRLYAFGENKTVIEWTKDNRCSIGYSSLVARISRGWNIEAAITLSLGEREDEKYIVRDDGRKRRGSHPDDPTYFAFNEKKTLVEWFEDDRCRLSDKRTLWSRINAGWNIEEAITKPPAANMGSFYEGRSILQISEDADCEVSYQMLSRRLKLGISVEEAKKNNLPEAFGEKKTLNAWSKDPRCKVNLTSLKKRLDKGMSLEAAITSANAFKGSK